MSESINRPVFRDHRVLSVEKRARKIDTIPNNEPAANVN